MKKKISLKKLELKINKINDLKAINIRGGGNGDQALCTEPGSPCETKMCIYIDDLRG